MTSALVMIVAGKYPTASSTTNPTSIGLGSNLGLRDKTAEDYNKISG
jgi:hypothetical protein